MLYCEMVEKMLFCQRGGRWVKSELARSRSEIPKIESVVEKTFGTHGSSGLFTRKCHLLHHLVDNLKGFESLFFKKAGSFEHFTVLTKKNYGMTSWRLSTKMHESVESMRSALDSVRRLKR